jgi:hypothetical protein
VAAAAVVTALPARASQARGDPETAAFRVPARTLSARQRVSRVVEGRSVAAPLGQARSAHPRVRVDGRSVAAPLAQALSAHPRASLVVDGRVSVRRLSVRRRLRRVVGDRRVAVSPGPGRLARRQVSRRVVGGRMSVAAVPSPRLSVRP